MMLQVDLGTKFTSAHFDKVISSYWEKSLGAAQIEFNLSKLEWVAIEQISFLVSWINRLAEHGKGVAIHLPTSKDVSLTSATFKRRQRCLDHLLVDWRFLKLLNTKVKVIEGGIRTTRASKRTQPYQDIAALTYDATSFDRQFYELYATTFSGFVEYANKEIQDNTLLSYFDNHFLHYSIIKEFYSNTCQHANSGQIKTKCYFSLASNSKVENAAKEKIDAVLAERYAERPTEEQHFFKTSTGKFKNASFIEFNLLDFGDGIAATLKDKYLSENPADLKRLLSPRHFEQHEDTRILEYAFLLFTSKYELGKDFEMHDYIPRGLYIIKDIVRRYNGMIIARSKNGKVVFSYSKENRADEVFFRENDDQQKIGTGFPGTSITIVLPEKDTPANRTDRYRASISNQPKPIPQVVSLLRFTNEILAKESVSVHASETEKRIAFFEEFFRSICHKLMALNSPSGDLVMFDFAGVERSSQDIYNKFIYFLAYCPLLSERLSLCIFNVVEKGIGQALLGGEAMQAKSQGFFTKPFPCVYPDLSVEWIGIENLELQQRITEVWRGNTSQNETHADLHPIAGGLIEVVLEDSTKTTFALRIQSFAEVLGTIHAHHDNFIRTELTDQCIEFHELKHEGKNYNNVRNRSMDPSSGKPRAYLTSNGLYQTEFLTFIEKLYIREYRRLVATYLLYNVCYSNSQEDSETSLRRTTKILTVTLSSQLLGKEFADILNELKITDTPVVLIPLSNYYDFNTEDSFREVHSGDSVIVVNDVISTGGLSRKICGSVLGQGASVRTILSIVDSRTKLEHKEVVNTQVLVLHRHMIEKYRENPFETHPVWVNPILNAPTSMRREKSNTESILLLPQEFADLFEDDKYFKVGSFRQNTRRLTYYLQTDEFLKSEVKDDFPVVRQILERLRTRVLADRTRQLKARTAEMSESYRQYINAGVSNPAAEVIINAFDTISEHLESLPLSVAGDQTNPAGNRVVDFIFYPFLSSISELEKNTSPISMSLGGGEPVSVYPLPRIMTPKGWRFSFPPKFMNVHTSNRSVLILDDGSCTGETIVQMIDALSFLEVKEIYVLSLFGRLEDFQREFLSRIARVTVKDRTSAYKTIPVSIYFGTHFHIPIYSEGTHPTTVELNEIRNTCNRYSEKGASIPKHLKDFTKTREEEISKPVNPRLASQQHSIIPTTVSRKLMFVLRDLIGGFESYRLFKEDELDHSPISSEAKRMSSLKELLSDSAGKETLISVLILEPHLVDSIRRIYPELLNDTHSALNIKLHIEEELQNLESAMDSTRLRFLVVGLFTIAPGSFCSYRAIMAIFQRVESLSPEPIDILNYIGYVYTALLFRTRERFTEELATSAKLVIQKLYLRIDQTGQHGKVHAGLIKELYNESLLNLDDYPQNEEVKLILEVRHYYLRQVSNHDGKEGASHPNYYMGFSSIVNRLGAYSEYQPNQDEKEALYTDLRELVEVSDKRLFNSLGPVLEFLEPFYLQNDLAIDIRTHRKALEHFQRLMVSVQDATTFIENSLSQESIPRLLKWLKGFNETFFNLRSELPAFFINSQANVRHVVERAMKEHESLKRNLKVTLSIPGGIELAVHPYLMRIVFYELFENKSKYAPDVNATVSYSESDRQVSITYQQESAFKEGIAENGLITIRDIARRHGGETVITREPYYTLTLVFHRDRKLDNL